MNVLTSKKFFSSTKAHLLGSSAAGSLLCFQTISHLWVDLRFIALKLAEKMSLPKADISEFPADVIFKSPSGKNKKNKNRNKSFLGTPFPAQIKLTIVDLRLFQQASMSYESVILDLSIDDQIVEFHSNDGMFNNRNNSTEFSFETTGNSAVYTVNEEGKRITGKVSITTSSSSFIPVYGVVNVPQLNTLHVTPGSTGIPPVNMPVMNGHTKVGEIKIAVEKYSEVRDLPDLLLF